MKTLTPMTTTRSHGTGLRLLELIRDSVLPAGALFLVLVHTQPLYGQASGGAVVAWGNNDDGQSSIPLAAQDGIKAITAGDFHTVALKNDGTVTAWGNNDDGQSSVPVGLNGVTAIS